jgi:type IV pilus assembly protein PilW
VFSGTGRFRESFDDAINTVIARADPDKKDAFGLRYNNVTGSNAAIFGCDNSVISSNNVCSPSGTSSALVIAYQTNTASNTSDLSPSVTTSVTNGSGSADCNGASPPANIDFVVNRYFVNAAGQLMCLGNGGATPGQIAANVEQFQVRYGIASGAEDKRVQILTASQVSATNAWNLVVQVELCLVMRGATGTDNNSSAFNNCNGSTTPTTDGRMRKTFRSVVSLRNSMG